MISLIAAIGKNNELGKGNDLIWRLPADQKFFRERTSGHTVIMGRKTFESLGRPLPNRKNIVITRDKTYLRPADAKALAGKHGVDVVHSLEEAIKLTSPQPLSEGEGAPSLSGKAGDEVFIIGGAEIFKQVMPIADRLYVTYIEAEDKEADTFFPEFNLKEWKVIFEEFHPKDEKHQFEFTFKIYKKNEA